MNTINGIAVDAEGDNLGVLITVNSLSTPQTNGAVVECNTQFTTTSNPFDGTFTLLLMAGIYTVTFGTIPNATVLTISIPAGPDTVYNFGDVVSSSVPILPGTPTNQLWNGVWAGNITFQPIPQPNPLVIGSPTGFTGGTINSIGSEHYSYWVSFVTATGETNVSPVTATVMGATPTNNSGLNLTLPLAPAGASAMRIWRTFVDTGSNYDVTTFPLNVGLLATVGSASSSYLDFEGMAAFAARVTAAVPPIYNTTAGQIFAVAGTPVMWVTASAIYFPGTNFRIKTGVGPQVYNPTTLKWYTIGDSGPLGSEQLGTDAGNPN